jgi:hypothetical protein
MRARTAAAAVERAITPTFRSMAYREFTDDDGVRWEVWDVLPHQVTPRLTHRLALPPELLGGWLAFYSAKEARRLAPIPATWPIMSDRELGAAVRRAPLLTRRPLLLGDRATQGE